MILRINSKYVIYSVILDLILDQMFFSIYSYYYYIVVWGFRISKVDFPCRLHIRVKPVFISYRNRYEGPLKGLQDFRTLSIMGRSAAAGLQQECFWLAIGLGGNFTLYCR